MLLLFLNTGSYLPLKSGELISSITEVDFGNVGNGQVSIRTITLRNDGAAPLVISGVRLAVACTP